MAYSSAPIEVRETLAKEQFVDALVSSEMRPRIKQSRPRDLNEAICHAVELDLIVMQKSGCTSQVRLSDQLMLKTVLDKYLVLK